LWIGHLRRVGGGADGEGSGGQRKEEKKVFSQISGKRLKTRKKKDGGGTI